MDPLDPGRLNWLDAKHDRLQEVYWWIENEGGTIREAIDALMALQKVK